MVNFKLEKFLVPTGQEDRKTKNWFKCIGTRGGTVSYLNELNVSVVLHLLSIY